jgi:hypothetical protein
MSDDFSGDRIIDIDPPSRRPESQDQSTGSKISHCHLGGGRVSVDRQIQNARGDDQRASCPRRRIPFARLLAEVSRGVEPG